MHFFFKPKFNWFDYACFAFTSWAFMETGNYWWIFAAFVLGFFSAMIELFYVVGDRHVSE